MAIRIDQVYPSQVDTTDPTGYPQGKPRNVGVSGDGTGFPFEEQWVSDLHGLMQAIMAESGLTYSDTPDKVGASQYLEGLKRAILYPSTKVPLLLAPVVSSRFVDVTSGGGTFWQQNDVTDQGFFVCPLALPLIGTLTEIHVTVDGGSGHSGLPANKPDVTLRRTTWTLGGAAASGSTVDTVVDGTASVPTYEAVHNISITGLSESLSELRDYWLQIRGESNANAEVDQFKILKAYAVITP